MSYSFALPDWVGIAIPLLVAIATLGLAAYLYLRTRELLNASVTTTGVVVRLAAHESSSGKGGSTLAPVVKFKTKGGVEIEFESGMSSSPALCDVGEEVPVIYRPGNPEEAEIKLFWSLWAMPVCLGGLGAFALLFPLLWLLKSMVPGPTLALVMFGGAGIGLLVTAVILWQRASGFLRNAMPTVGVVTKVMELKDMPELLAKMVDSLPVTIKFNAPSGREIEFSTTPPSGMQLAKGAQVPVLYDPSRPGSARIKEPLQSRRVAVLLAVLGIALLSMVVFMGLLRT
jgi:hypothetical protein